MDDYGPGNGSAVEEADDCSNVLQRWMKLKHTQPPLTHWKARVKTSIVVIYLQVNVIITGVFLTNVL
jgi:hypothetical protein